MKHVSVVCGAILAALMIGYGCQTPPSSNPTPAPTTSSPTATPSATASPSPTLLPSRTPSPPAQNLLTNADFESGCRQSGPDQCIPLGWSVSDNCLDYSPHVEDNTHPPHVFWGSHSALLWQDWRACQMTLYQTLPATPGAVYQLLAQGFSKGQGLDSCPGCPDKDQPSPPELAGYMRVCVDPDGGQDINDGDVRCGPVQQPQDAFEEFDFLVAASGSSITVFLDGWFVWGVTRNSLVWDQAELYFISGLTPQSLPDFGGGGIIEVEPNVFDYGVGTLEYTVQTTLRTCQAALDPALGWPSWGLDPVGQWPAVLDEAGQTIYVRPGDRLSVWGFGFDRSGNLWAWYDAIGGLTASLCYRGVSRADFYPGIRLADFERARADGVLPQPTGGCSITP